MSSQSLVNIGWGNGLVPSGNKPLPEPVLTCCLDSEEHIWMISFETKRNNFNKMHFKMSSAILQPFRSCLNVSTVFLWWILHHPSLFRGITCQHLPFSMLSTICQIKVSGILWTRLCFTLTTISFINNSKDFTNHCDICHLTSFSFQLHYAGRNINTSKLEQNSCHFCRWNFLMHFILCKCLNFM